MSAGGAAEPRYIRADDGVKIAYRDEGDPASRALLLCSIGTASLSIWDPIAAALNRRSRVIRYDRRGDGDSDAGVPESHSFSRYADDALCVMDACRCRKAVICGMAFGARVAYHLAMRSAERIAGLILFDATGGPPAPESLRKEGHRHAAEARRQAGLPDVCFDSRWFHRRDPQGAGLSRHAFAGMPDWTPGLATIRAPTMIACGEFDPNFNGAKRLAGEIPGARFVSMAMTGHASILDRPDLVLSLIEGFLATL